MIYDLRIYSIKPGMVQQWLDNYEQYGYPVQRKFLGEPVAFTTTVSGPLNQVVHLWKYESEADREAKRNTMAKDPGWPEYLRRSAELGAVLAQENRILEPASFVGK